MASIVGIVGVSVVSVPTTLSVTSIKEKGDIFQPLNTTITKIKTAGETYFQGFDQQLQNQYLDFGGKIINNTKEGLSSVGTQMDEIKKLGEDSASLVNDNKENINYYAFQLGDLIKAAIRHIPTIIRDSVVEIIQEGVEQNLLGVQKIYAIAKDGSFGDFVASLVTVVNQYSDLISKISTEDTNGVMQIFRELQKEKIGSFLSKVKENVQSLDSNKSSYCKATKLMMHVLIGKNEIEKITEVITNLKQQLSTLEDSLKSILSEINVEMENLRTQLENISTSQKIKDPCASTPN